MRDGAVGNRSVVKKLFVIALVLAVLRVYAPGATHALSCVEPVMNESVVAGAAVIFEGVTGRHRALSRAENAALDAAGVVPLGGGIVDLKVFDFTVTKGWKGTAEGQEIQVLRNTYWGDSFATEGLYLVVGVQAAHGLYLAPLCGNTMYLGAPGGAPGDSAPVKALERLIGTDARSRSP